MGGCRGDGWRRDIHEEAAPIASPGGGTVCYSTNVFTGRAGLAFHRASFERDFGEYPFREKRRLAEVSTAAQKVRKQ
jgi:hypothetical protein